MFRALTALGALALAATAASAQPGRLPLSPGVVPAAPFGPGYGMAAQSPALMGRSPIVLNPLLPPWGVAFPTPYPFYGYPFGGYGYPFATYVPPVAYLPAPSAIAEAPRRSDPTVVLANEYPATLTLQFPTSAEVWLDGKKVDGSAAEERVLTSPVLKPGEQYTFAVRARWTNDGKTYETKRSVKLGSGDRSRLLIIAGEEVKE